MQTKVMQRVTAFFILVALLISMTVPRARAVVVADDLIGAGVLGVIAAVWCASGAEFDSADDLWAAAQHIYDTRIKDVPDLLSELQSMAKAWVNGWGGPIGKVVGFITSNQLWKAICGDPAEEITDGYLGSKVKFTVSTRAELKAIIDSEPYIYDNGFVFPASKFWTHSATVNDYKFWVETTDDSFIWKFQRPNGYIGTAYTENKGDLTDKQFYPYWGNDSRMMFIHIGFRGDSHASAGGNFFSSELKQISAPYTIDLGGFAIPVGGTITEPADTAITLPDIPAPSYDEEGKVVLPDIPLDPGKYRTDVADIPHDTALPEDTVIDLSTGETVDTDVPDTPAEPVGTIDKIFAAISGFFDSPSDFDVNFDAFKGAILSDRFPFSIPFDFVNAIRVWSAQAADYQLVIDLDTSYFKLHKVIDLSPFVVPLAFFRYGATLWFAIALMLKTRDLIKW